MQTINIGTSGNDGTGDTLRAGGQIINDNFAALEANKVDKVAGKGLSTEDYTTTEKNKLAGIEANANNYVLPSDVVQDATYVKTDNNYTTAEKDKLAGIEAGAEINPVDTDEIPEGAINKYDKVLSLLAGAGIEVTGTYPNFTVTNTATSGSVTSVNGETGVVVLDSDDIAEGTTNLYDKIVTLTEGTNVTITGTYPNFTINATGGGEPTDGDKGDITVSGSGTTWTIDNDAVTFAKIQNITTNKLLGRHSSGNGDTEEVGIGNNLEISGSNLQAKTGTTAGTVATGDHLHTGVYEPADATILKDADIGVTVQAHSTILDNTTASYTTTEASKLAGIEAGAEVNTVDSVNGRTGAVTGLAEANAVVNLTTAQTVAGVKTFSSSPIVPTPTTNFQAATKKYVDDNAGGDSFPTVIYTSSETNFGNGTNYSFTHNLGLTQYDVERGRYSLLIGGRTTSTPFYGRFLGPGQQFHAFIAHYWLNSNPGSSLSVHHEENIIRLRIDNGKATNSARLMIIQNF